MMGCESGVLSPTYDELNEPDLNSGIKRRHRRSFGGKFIEDKTSYLSLLSHPGIFFILKTD